MYVHEMVQRELLQRSPMGRPDEIIQVDECLKKGKRKANCGHLMTGDTVPATLQNNHGGVADYGRWVFGLLWVSSDQGRRNRGGKGGQSPPKHFYVRARPPLLPASLTFFCATYGLQVSINLAPSLT